MSVDLPTPIAIYIAAENRGDADAMAECFAEHAVVRDEGQTIDGLAAIKRWKAETKKKYNHTIAPLEVAQRDGKTVLTAKLTGNFPGSPVTLEFSFMLEEGKIVLLEIH
ncbi:MAG: nuclear transport factor 2 family protein [Vulcanimicrobiaceae bacterium]